MPLNVRKDGINDHKNGHVRQRTSNCNKTIDKFDRPSSEGGIPSNLNVCDTFKDGGERPKSHN